MKLLLHNTCFSLTREEDSLLTIEYEINFKWTSVSAQEISHNQILGKTKTGNIGTYVDELIAIIPAEGISNVLYAHQDRQYNLRGLTDANGDLVEYYAYSPYGERTAYDSNGTEIDQTAVELKTEYGFTGRRYDMESDLWYFRARYFDTEMGRFVSRDPLGFVDGFGLYNGYFAEGFTMDPMGKNRFKGGNGWVPRTYSGLTSNCCNNYCLNYPGLSYQDRRRCRNQCMAGKVSQCNNPPPPPPTNNPPPPSPPKTCPPDPGCDYAKCQGAIDSALTKALAKGKIVPGLRLKTFIEGGYSCCGAAKDSKSCDACVIAIKVGLMAWKK